MPDPFSLWTYGPPVELPYELFHYTSQTGLIGIVSSRCLWATDIRYLNDSSEYSYGASIIRNVLSKNRKGTRGSKRKFFEEVDIAPDFNFRYFAISLTEEGDLLSQWRGYTPNGNGFSIGFEVERLQEAKGELMMVKCIYDQAEQEAFVRNMIDKTLEYWDRYNEEVVSEKKQSAEELKRTGRTTVTQRFYPPFFFKAYCSTLAPVFKRASFSEEKEWRLIIMQSAKHTIKFRPGLSMIMPYIEITLAGPTVESQSEEDSQSHSLPINEIIVGPTPHPDLSHAAVQMLLETHGVKASVRGSDIPFRSW